MNKVGLIFDMDGVVVANDRYHYLSWQEFAREHSRDVSFDEVKSWFGSTNDKILQNFFGRKLSQKEIENFSKQKELIYRRIYKSHIKAVEGLKTFLEKASDEGFKIALATSAPPENVEFVLSETSLSKFFSEITDDSQIINGKPDPEIFLKTSDKIGLPPSKCIVFEDSFHGIEAARRAGMKVIALATTHQPERLKNASKIINDFTEIEIGDLSELLTNKQ